MFEDVLEVLASCRGYLADVVVVTTDDTATALAEQRNFRVVSDRGNDGINAAIQLGLDYVVKNNGTGVLVVPSDIPHLTREVVAQAVNAIGSCGSLAILQAVEDGGTNLLACRSANGLPLCYGPLSFKKHCEAAHARGLNLRVLPAGDLGLDIDRPENLAAFLALKSKTRTHALLASLAIFGHSHLNFPLLDNFSDDRNLTRNEALRLISLSELAPLLHAASGRRDRAHGTLISYSRKVFIPLTKLCRDVCHYCTFARPARAGEPVFLSHDEVLAIAYAGRDSGCKEALFTLGDKPELRYRAARDELARLGHSTTLSYLAEMARLVFEQTGLLPHVNPGLLDAHDLAALRKASISQGVMLESASSQLMEKGAPHHGSPDKNPASRLATIRMAGEQRVHSLRVF